MFISVLELFKIGIGPSSSHTIGPMVAAKDFIGRIGEYISSRPATPDMSVRCTLKGSLAFTGKGHVTDNAVTLGLHGYVARDLVNHDVTTMAREACRHNNITVDDSRTIHFSPDDNIIFDQGPALKEHTNGMIFDLLGESGETLLTETYFSIGGGFINTLSEINQLVAPIKTHSADTCPYPFDSARSMLAMAAESGRSIASMKHANELKHRTEEALDHGLDDIWESMQACIKKGLATDTTLPGGLNLPRRAKNLHEQLQDNPGGADVNDWLSAYAMAVNEENAAGSMVVTAPTNGAAGVIPAVLYYYVKHENGSIMKIKEFLLTASAIGGIIKHRSSISGAEVGCQGEVGAAAAMAAAGWCAIHGGTPEQVENAAEIALEHHLGMTCDPVKGLVQVPCIERNAFGAIKAHAAASLAIHGTGKHFMPLDNCIEAMKQTGLEMSAKYKETSLGGLAVSITEC
ncbi:MAG: L-serine ammonia-lyase [Gammaproteobacteria bacterium]|nr:L-serine ammonia-lyase [Gammaproteobacteria bacterium]